MPTSGVAREAGAATERRSALHSHEARRSEAAEKDSRRKQFIKK